MGMHFKRVQVKKKNDQSRSDITLTADVTKTELELKATRLMDHSDGLLFATISTDFRQTKETLQDSSTATCQSVKR